MINAHDALLASLIQYLTHLFKLLIRSKIPVNAVLVKWLPTKIAILIFAENLGEFDELVLALIVSFLDGSTAVL